MTFRLLPLASLLLAVGLLAFLNVRRIARVEYVSSLAGGAAAPEQAEPASWTGYANARRYLIVPERHEPAAARIVEAQRSSTEGDTRGRWTEDENAPVGRTVFTASPPRWWLTTVARVHHAVSPRAPGSSVERAALVAEPLVHLLLLLGFAVFCAWQFGIVAALGFSVGCVTLFPFAASFLPGVPDGRGLVLGCALGSLFTALAGWREPARARSWFAISGLWGGVGLWLDVRSQIIVLAGIAAGGLLAQWMGRRDNAPAIDGSAWRLWSLAGAVTSLAGYLLEYAPAHVGGWELRANHPLYALAWLGVGELLAQLAQSAMSTRPRNRTRTTVALGLAVAGIAFVPLAMTLTASRGFLATDLSLHRLTALPGSVVASSTGAWLGRDSTSAAVWATLLPLTILAVLVGSLVRNRIAPAWRPAVTLTLGSVLITGAFAYPWIREWALVDCALLVALVAGLAGASKQWLRWQRAAWAGVLVAVAISGVAAAWPQRAGPATVLTRTEGEQLIERDLAHWLSTRAGQPRAIVYAPPQVTSSLCYFGGFRGLGTLAAGNEAGLGLSLAIASARTIEEVQWALQSRGVRYVVVPSWDPFFDDFARLYLVPEHANRVSFFVQELRRWHLPAWLRPIAYSPPVIKGMESASVLVLEVVEEQPAALAGSRLAEFLVETGRNEDARQIEDLLRRFPGDLGALTARAQIQTAQGNSAAFAATITTIRSRLASQADRYLAWDRRVALAAVLAQADQLELSRAQVQRCVAEADQRRLRMLNEGALYRLLVLSDAFALPLPGPDLRPLAAQLLSPELRQQL